MRASMSQLLETLNCRVESVKPSGGCDLALLLDLPSDDSQDVSLGIRSNLELVAQERSFGSRPASRRISSSNIIQFECSLGQVTQKTQLPLPHQTLQD